MLTGLVGMVGAAASSAQAQPATSPAPASDAPTETHSFEQVIELAKNRAQSADNAEQLKLRGPFADLDYDRFRGIRFRRAADPIADSGSQFGIDLLPPGGFYKDRVSIYLVKGGIAREIAFDPTVFDFDPHYFDPDNLELGDDARRELSWSGFRLRFPINNPDVMDEFAVFQGASYFRAVARDTLYGLSARGLALNTGGPEGEEFPRFTRFWIYQPEAEARSIRIEALLESASLTGAYAMEIMPGAETVFVIKSSLFPRRDITHFGIAPLTSMYYFSPSRRANIDDYRNAVHDSEGLAMHTGHGKRLWRPLNNPPTLQFSAFQDEAPKGFGLFQRKRSFHDYQDAEARYDKRPSAWVIPHGNWGRGHLSLIEIPVNNEFNDNIVAFWSPSTPLRSGERADFNYDLVWSMQGSSQPARARVVASRSGQTVNNPATFTVTVDFAAEEGAMPDPATLHLDVQASAGEIRASHLARLPDSGHLRAAFEYAPAKKENAELQLRLNDSSGQQIAESWYYRWIPL